MLVSFSLLHSHIPEREAIDKLTWKLNHRGTFDSRSFYYALHIPKEERFPWKSIWAVKAPRRVAFFVWIVTWGWILTCDNLKKHGYVMQSWCCMCKDAEETVDHLFLHCGVAREIWSFVLQSFGIEWVLPYRVMELLFGWWNWFGKSSSGLWNLVPPLSDVDDLAGEEQWYFENIESPMGKIIENFFGSLYDWSWAWGLAHLLP